MNPHEYDVLEALQRLINHYGRAAIRKDAAPAVFEPNVAILPGCWETHKDVLGYLADKRPPGETPPRHGKSTWPTPGYFVSVAPDLDPTVAHMAVLCVDGSPYTVTFTSGADPHKALAEALRVAGLAVEARDGALALALYAAPTPLPDAPPTKNRAQRRLRPGKRPPDTSAKRPGGAPWRGSRR